MNSMNSIGRAPLARALAIGGLALASLSVGCRDLDAPAAANEQTDPPPIAPTPIAPTPTAPIDARIAFTSTREGESYIYVATADGSQIRRLAKGERPTWSPDGRWIAFNAPSNNTIELRIIGVDGSGERVIASPAGISAWSPDGTKIVFSRVDPVFPTAGLFVVHPDGSGLTRLLSADFEDPPGNWLNYPTWSPDGKSIAFLRSNDYMFWPAYVVNADGSSPRMLRGHDGNIFEPSWSPDGTKLAVGHLSLRIGTMNADGSGLQLYPPARAFDPDWSPDGRSLIFKAFASPVGDSPWSAGSKMRIYVLDLQTLDVRQLIPDAIDPKNPSYRDDDPAWLRSNKSSAP